MSVDTDAVADDSGTVWVVTYRIEGGPHSHIAGVYSTEQAAREHKVELARNPIEYGAIAWRVHEETVGSHFEGGV